MRNIQYNKLYIIKYSQINIHKVNALRKHKFLQNFQYLFSKSDQISLFYAFVGNICTAFDKNSTCVITISI